MWPIIVAGSPYNRCEAAYIGTMPIELAIPAAIVVLHIAPNPRRVIISAVIRITAPAVVRAYARVIYAVDTPASATPPVAPASPGFFKLQFLLVRARTTRPDDVRRPGRCGPRCSR